MKIEVDLNDLFCDEDGAPCETMQEHVEREVVRHLTRKIEDGIGRQIDAEVSRVIGEKLEAIAEELLPKLAQDMIDAEYQPVSSFGQRGETTTFRKELLRMVTYQLAYKKARCESERNIFTKTVDAVISENIKAFQVEFNKLVTERFRKEALAHAVTQLKKALGL